MIHPADCEKRNYPSRACDRKHGLPRERPSEIRRAVFRGIVRKRIFVLIGALVIDVETEVNVEPAVAVIVSDCRASESALWRISELKGIALLPELSAALVDKQQRAIGSHDNQILSAVVIYVGE